MNPSIESQIGGGVDSVLENQLLPVWSNLDAQLNPMKEGQDELTDMDAALSPGPPCHQFWFRGALDKTLRSVMTAALNQSLSEIISTLDQELTTCDGVLVKRFEKINDAHGRRSSIEDQIATTVSGLDARLINFDVNCHDQLSEIKDILNTDLAKLPTDLASEPKRPFHQSLGADRTEGSACPRWMGILMSIQATAGDKGGGGAGFLVG
ncbi:hypothetical protein HOY82DRAFT_600836 [Tuber indicum]|nr:hypothetical protein HOY82DRAFT_600836 [Tuber indicum]